MRFVSKPLPPSAHLPSLPRVGSPAPQPDPFARLGSPEPLTANHIRNHGRARSHVRAVQEIDHATLDAALKEMDQ